MSTLGPGSGKHSSEITTGPKIDARAEITHCYNQLFGRPPDVDAAQEPAFRRFLLYVKSNLEPRIADCDEHINPDNLYCMLRQWATSWRKEDLADPRSGSCDPEKSAVAAILICPQLGDKDGNPDYHYACVIPPGVFRRDFDEQLSDSFSSRNVRDAARGKPEVFRNKIGIVFYLPSGLAAEAEAIESFADMETAIIFTEGSFSEACQHLIKRFNASLTRLNPQGFAEHCDCFMGDFVAKLLHQKISHSSAGGDLYITSAKLVNREGCKESGEQLKVEYIMGPAQIKGAIFIGLADGLLSVEGSTI